MTSHGIHDVLYTPKEYSMHVSGSEGFCDRSILAEHLATQTSILSDEDAQRFHINGFYCAKKVIQQALIDDARRYIDASYQSWLKKSRRQDDWRMHLLLDLSDLSAVEHVPILNLLIQSPLALQRLQGLMGCAPAGIFYNQIAYRTPLSATAQTSLEYQVGAEYHIDGQANAFGTRFPDPWTVLMGVALVDIITEDKGNFTVFPGGHTARNWCNYPEEKRAKTLPSLGPGHHVCLAAGDAVFVHSLLPHRGGKNTRTSQQILGDHNVTLLNEMGSESIQHIQAGTREMVFFRVRGQDIDYGRAREKAVLADPFTEYPLVRNQVSLSGI
jgi:hypothetical protein